MLCEQATLRMLLPELWIFILWPPLLLHLIYQSAHIASTAVDNCCIHLLWIYAASNRCEYTAATAVVHPKPLLWYFVHCSGYHAASTSCAWIYCCHGCGYYAAFTCCGHTTATVVDQCSQHCLPLIAQ